MPAVIMQNELYFLFVIQLKTHLKETFEKVVFCRLLRRRGRLQRELWKVLIKAELAFHHD